ncbi:S8 family serine peptidase [Flavihumibacter profundi]|uniref:S8 family serine peptidase n=1 Tax=Flavihumibacter profundi TaxID=2716883 RepID=UPI001CC41B0E|nr:S8 family serine peptidase [Flavihumibacter profundi]MBZ5856142.1 S8 family serine peptidase [Flavihumibacter profundi]
MNRPLCLPRVLLVWLICFSAIRVQAQRVVPVYFKNAVPANSFRVEAIDPLNMPMQALSSGNNTSIFLQFSAIPNNRQKQVLKARGIDLLEYIPENTFLATVKGKWSADALKSLGIIATIPLTKYFKATVDNANAYARVENQPEVLRTYHLNILPGMDTSQVKDNIATILRGRPEKQNPSRFLNNRLLEISLGPSALGTLLDQPFVLYAMPAAVLKPLNNDATDRLEAHVVQQGIAGMPGLSGNNVVMGMGDEGRIDHVDNGYNEDGQDYNSSYHSTHVAGTLVGAGIVNPLMRGFAYKSTLLVDFFNNIIYRAPEYYQTKRMVLTNNSYGAGSYCVPYSGEYSGYSGQADQQALDYPNMLHVFAAGNSGDLQCGNYPVGYHSIDNSFQAGKNVITVAGTSHDGLSNKFSKGPVNDGRIKPEIAAIGNSMWSTIMGNGYGPNQGTSMAAPQVTGALALMVERYRQLNGDQDPPGDLLKVILCNTATDIGTKGVDFSNGFGWMNVKKAIDDINARSYRSGIIEQDQEQVFEIQLDKEVFDFKVMLYWHDRPSSYYTLKNLVNDLDITVQAPNGTTYDPFVLDTSAAGVLKPAVMGKDHLNNIEQVVIDNAIPGTYTIRVKGYKVPFGPQAFKVAYNWEEPGLQIIQPVGGEQWKPGEQRGIHWQDAGHDADTYSFDYSLDDGNTWTNLPGITGSYNRVDWTLPDVQSAAARIRITNTVSGASRISAPFVILPEINFSVTSSCSSEVQVKWTKPAGIDSVEVLLYAGKRGDFVQQTVTTDSSWILNGLKSGPNYWITLRPILAGKPGERSVAQMINTPNLKCIPTGASGDLALSAILMPPTAREGSSTALSGAVPVILKLENKGNTPVADSIVLDIFKNGIFWGKDTLVKSFAAREQYNWTTKFQFPAVAGTSLQLQAAIAIPGDPDLSNNHCDSTWRYLANTALSLPYTEDFSTLEDTVYAKPGITGAFGALAWDFSSASPAVSLIARHQEPQKGFTTYCKTDYQSFQLIGTFNLSGYQLTDNVRANISIPSLNSFSLSIYIRGNDLSPWLVLPIYDPITGISSTKNMNISGVLAKGKQSFSSSFQIRLVGNTRSFLQEIQILNELKLFTSKADLSLVDLNYTQSRVTDGDSMHIVIGAYNKKLTTNGAFSLGIKAPDGNIQSVLIDSLGSNQVAYAPFTIKVQDWPNAVAPIVAWVADPEDSFPDDDSLQAIIAYSRKISKFPYLQGFEQGEAGWGSTFIYGLSNKLSESVAPFKPANGKIFWGTRWVDYNQQIANAISSGYLVSPWFDLSSLKKPWLSMSVNKQLCNGMDSILIQYSVDTGRTWATLNPASGTTNWYDLPGQGSWKNCGNDYWQVVSAPLPAPAAGIQLRVLSQGSNYLSEELPRLPGGLLVDDVHIFDLAYPVFDQPTAVTAPQKSELDNWDNYTEQGKTMAASQPISASAGNSFRLSAQIANRSYNGNRVLPKSWIFNGSPVVSENGRVRLYFTHKEVMDWLSVIPCDTCIQKRSPYDLAVYRYSGPSPGINETDADNIPGYDEVWPADAFDLVPYESGYYAEVPAAAYGEFYIGLDEKGSGLLFEASRQPGANIVLLNWTKEHPEEVDHFEVERAARSNSTLDFKSIGTVSGSPLNTSYRFRDIRLQPPGAWHYRLKIVYKNGDIRYSAIRTISFDAGILVKLYPNPSADGKVKLLLQNAEGKNVELALYDQAGRYLWGQHIEAMANQQLVPLSIGNGKLPNGVYALKITAEGEKKTIQLVISRN